MIIIRTETIQMAMKALKMRDEDLVGAFTGVKSNSGSISSFDLNRVSELTTHVVLARSLSDDWAVDDMLKDKATVKAIVKDDLIIATIPDSMALPLMRDDGKSTLAILSAILDASFKEVDESIHHSHMNSLRSNVSSLIELVIARRNNYCN